MKRIYALNWLVPLIILLAAVAAASGLLWPGGGSPHPFNTLRGETATIDGRGLYRYDTLFSAATFRATDTITLLVGIPLLAAAFIRYRRGSLRGGLLLAGTLTYFVYVGVSMAFGAAFNSLFLVYVGLFSSSLCAFIVALMAIDAGTLLQCITPGFPWRGGAVFLFVAGAGVIILWLSELIGPLAAGRAPALLGPYTTMFTYGIDMAVIAPAAIGTGILLLRRSPLGVLLAAPMLVLCTLNGVVVIASTAAQTLAGITFPIGVYIGLIGSWVVLGAFAIGLAVSLFRHISGKGARQNLPPAGEAPGAHEPDESRVTETVPPGQLLHLS